MVMGIPLPHAISDERPGVSDSGGHKWLLALDLFVTLQTTSRVKPVRC